MRIIQYWKSESSGPFKKKLIKASIGFILFIAAFTILSRAAFSVTAAQVKTAEPLQQKISRQISAMGELKGRQELAVTVQEGLPVESVSVMAGETVNRGSTLFTIQSKNLESAIEACRQELKGSSKEVPEQPDSNIDRKQTAEKLRELLRLQAGGGRVTAPADGLITEVNLKAGDKTVGGGEIRYADASQGLRLTVQIPEEDRRYLKKGGKVTITGENDGADTKGKIKSIAVDGENPELYNVTAELSGKKFKIGTMATMAISSADKIYDVCIPREALYQGEDNSYYVYVIREVESILGKQLAAEKVPVQVIDKDETMAALEELEEEAEVIVEASKELEDQSQVRRIEP